MPRRSVPEKIADAKKHGLLDLTHSSLYTYPGELTAPELGNRLFRLDLSFNRLTSLPDAIGSLKSLQILWVNHNPFLTNLPKSLAQCKDLTVIDASATSLDHLPCQLSLLSKLVVLDIQDTPLEKRWIEKKHIKPSISSDPSQPVLIQCSKLGVATNTIARNGQIRPLYESSDNQYTNECENFQLGGTMCQQILEKLRYKDERANLKTQLVEKLQYDIYNLKSKDENEILVLQSTIYRVLKLFPEADDVKGLIRNAERIFPQRFLIQSMETLDATVILSKYKSLKIENTLKKKKADLELKIRSLYFGKIDTPTVERVIQEIYAKIQTLPDIKFLIFYATHLFPSSPKDINADNVYAKLIALKTQFAQERADAQEKLLHTVQNIYNDTEPDQVHTLVVQIMNLFKNTAEIRSVIASASSLFPPEFLNAQASVIRTTFLRMKADAMGGTPNNNNAASSAIK